MRISLDLINNSLSYLNTIKEREIDLRGMLMSLLILSISETRCVKYVKIL